MLSGVSTGEIDRLVAGQHHDPHSILGVHPAQGPAGKPDGGPAAVTIRALRPFAASVEVVLPDGSRHPMTHTHAGVFAVTLRASQQSVQDYRLLVTYPQSDHAVTQDDPYRHLPTLGEFDLHLIGEGRHEELWKVLGAHARPGGTAFAVWAPSARGVRLLGDFNYWDGAAYPMRSLGGSGIWELFVPDIGDGAKYKYSICGPDDVWREHADPLAQRTETPPATASVVFTSQYEWDDGEWMVARPGHQPVNEPMSVYEVHLGSWRPGLSYRELATEMAAYVTRMGFTHVEFLPVMEHPFGGSWGYQVTSYYAPTSRFGSPDDFRFLVDTLHRAGIGVIVDWVPAHFPRDSWALALFDGTPLYEHADPRLGAHPDWGTLVFNYGRTEVRNFLVANALYWLLEFHVDGLRVDAVASMLYLDYSRRAGEWVPNVYGGRENLEAISFLQEVNSVCYRKAPGITMIAEESTAWPGVTRPVHLGGLGFGFKWNMGWMNDTLSYLRHDPVHRQYHHNEITFSLIYAFSENYILPLSHDEVVHGKGSLVGKMPGDEWRRFAGLRGLFAFMWAHPGKQLLFMGSEFGQGNEWSESAGLDWWVLEFDVHSGVQHLVRDLNREYRLHPALWAQDSVAEGFTWIDAHDAHGNVLAFLRNAPATAPEAARAADAARTPSAAGTPATGTPSSAPAVVACIANFSAMPHHNYRIGLPQAGRWREVINTDAAIYGGSGVGNMGAVEAVSQPWHGQPASASITVPPLGVLWLAPE